MLYTVGTTISFNQKKIQSEIDQKKSKTDWLFDVGDKVVFLKMPSLQTA